MASNTSPTLEQAQSPSTELQTDPSIQNPGAKPSAPVEMSNLTTNATSDTDAENPPATAATSTSNAAALQSVQDHERGAADQTADPSGVPAPSLTAADDVKDDSAIGASTERILSQSDSSGGRALQITLLLTSGARHPYKIDEKYLNKRNVNNADGDPFNISVYTLKELIWREWREEWEPRSSSPSSIRLIHFGRLLDDKSALKDCRFNIDGPNVVHMTVRPQEVVDEEDAKTGKKGLGGDRDGQESTPRCRCVIL